MGNAAHHQIRPDLAQNDQPETGKLD